MNPHTGRDFVQFGKTESVLNKGAKKIALLFNPPPVLSLVIIHGSCILCICHIKALVIAVLQIAGIKPAFRIQITH